MFTTAIIALFALAASAAPAPQAGVVTAGAGITNSAANIAVNTANTVTSNVGITVGPANITAVCDTTTWQCTGGVSGAISMILTDGKQYSGQTSLTGYCGVSIGCTGFSTQAGSGYVPINLTCNSATGQCQGTFAGSLYYIFGNGQMITEWGVGIISGACVNGNCTGSLNLSGDPTY
ncbi:hypothetical protein K490DRAFT_69844 [Saccharata proteae CBS 121410]|uniref:Uncharacterized protein n=1 Tax=Saccharata proteae CBS 121410 TaxID=1314787 RepID=A0A9P4LTV2_9PEZI|nr:hypothetical protein K490DRAFT_69844 [Saccharata proteae CBS 121410]